MDTTLLGTRRLDDLERPILDLDEHVTEKTLDHELSVLFEGDGLDPIRRGDDGLSSSGRVNHPDSGEHARTQREYQDKEPAIPPRHAGSLSASGSTPSTSAPTPSA